MAYLRNKNIFDQFGTSDLYDNYGVGQDDMQDDYNQYQQPEDVQGGDYDQSHGYSAAPTAGAPQAPNPIEEVRAAYQPKPGEPAPTFADYMNSMRNAYHPQTAATDQYNELLKNAPQLNHPSIGRSIAAGMVGFGQDPKVSEGVMFAPAMRDMALWKEKTKPFYDAANLENQGNNIERQLVGNMATAYNADMRQRGIDEKNRVSSEAAMMRAKAQALKAEGFEFKKDGDRWVGFKASTGERVDLGPSGGLDEADAAILNSRVRGQNIYQGPAGSKWEMGPDGQLHPIEGGPQGPITRIGTPSKYAPGPGGEGGGGSSAPNTLESERQRAVRLRSAYESVEGADKFIKQMPGGKFELVPRPVQKPGTLWGWKVSPEEVAAWDRVKKAVDPDYVIPAGGAGAKGGVNEVPNVKPSATKGLGPQTVPKVPRDKQIQEELNNPNLSGRQRDTLNRELTEFTGEVSRKKNREQEILQLLMQPENQSGRNHDALQYELAGLRNQGSKQQSTVVSKQYSPSRNATRITYSDGRTETVQGQQ